MTTQVSSTTWRANSPFPPKATTKWDNPAGEVQIKVKANGQYTIQAENDDGGQSRTYWAKSDVDETND